MALMGLLFAYMNAAPQGWQRRFWRQHQGLAAIVWVCGARCPALLASVGNTAATAV